MKRIRKRSQLPKRRSPQQILKDLGLTKEQVEKEATSMNLKQTVRKIPLSLTS
jgi:uncharacterized protein YjiS (DUF1127 family)